MDLRFLKIFEKTEFIFVIALIVPFIFHIDYEDYGLLIEIFLGIVMFLSMRPFFQHKFDLSTKKRHIFHAIFLNYILLSGLYVLFAYLFFGTQHPFFIGYTLIAVVPPAIAIVPLCYLSKCDTDTADSAILLSYILALLIIPAGLIMMYGKSVSMYQLLKVLLVLIIIPLILAFLSRDSHNIIFSNTKSLTNICLGVVIFSAISINREVFFDFTNPEIFYVYLINFIVIFGAGFLVHYVARRYTTRQDAITYALYASHKNVATAIAAGIFLFDAKTAIPAIIALVLQFLFFILFERFFVKMHLKHLNNTL